MSTGQWLRTTVERHECDPTGRKVPGAVWRCECGKRRTDPPRSRSCSWRRRSRPTTTRSPCGSTGLTITAWRLFGRSGRRAAPWPLAGTVAAPHRRHHSCTRIPRSTATVRQAVAVAASDSPARASHAPQLDSQSTFRDRRSGLSVRSGAGPPSRAARASSVHPCSASLAIEPLVTRKRVEVARRWTHRSRPQPVGLAEIMSHIRLRSRCSAVSGCSIHVATTSTPSACWSRRTSASVA